MFDISDTKTFMDIVHGYISIPKVFVSNIIDTSWFQRLRFIDQTGMKVVFPDGKHDRFCHTLGVYYLGQKAVDALLENFRNESFGKGWNNFSAAFWAKNKVLFLIACLLHDVGHAPFSHSLEDIVLANSGVIRVEQDLVEKINELERLSSTSIEKPLSINDLKASAHEKIGALFIIEKLRDTLEKTLREIRIDSSDLGEDLCFIARMILGLKYQSYQPEKQIQNCFIELLNGKNFDVDKLDYIIRDTKMSGISNITVDVERLIGALTIVTTTRYKNYTFNESTGDFAEKDFFIKEIKTDENHGITLEGNMSASFRLNSKTEAFIPQNSEFLRLSASSSDISPHERNAGRIKLKYAVRFDGDTKVYLDGRGIPEEPDPSEGTVNCSDFKDFHSFTIDNATVNSDGGFRFAVDEKSSLGLDVQGYSQISICGLSSVDSAKFKGTITGYVGSMIVVGDRLKEYSQKPSEKEYNEFSIGFKKQAINIISNVLDARDYLYLWIYAHHKVIYYANYLLPQLSEILSKFLNHRDFPAWKLDYEDLLKLDDAYIITALKYIKQNYSELDHDLSEHERTLLNELFQRKYKNSLYKSLAEYDLFFADFTDAEKQKIKKHLLENSEKQSVDGYVQKDEEMNYGVLTKQILAEVSRISEMDLSFLKSLVWVDARYKYNKIDFSQVYSVFTDETTTMKRLKLLSSRAPIQSGTTNYYYYLYYELNSPDETGSSRRHIKKALLLYFKNLCRHPSIS